MPWPKLGRRLFTLGGVQRPGTSWPPLCGMAYKAIFVRARENNSFLASQPPQGTPPSCPTRSRMVWEFLDLRILFGEPHSPYPDSIITSSLPSGGGRNLLFAFSCTRPPQPLAGFPKPPPDVWVTLVPKPAGSPESLGLRTKVPLAMPFSPVSLIPLSLWTCLCPFPYPRTLPLPHSPIGGLAHMGAEVCARGQLERLKVGEGEALRFDLGRRVG